MSKPLCSHIDEWRWGKEQILWGYEPDHRYTFKVLEPKKGREGCLSLQYHHEKSETWAVFRGTAWAMVVVNGEVCTRLMKAGDVQNLSAGMIHRLMAVSDDVQVLEPSTPDAHAADKNAPKDVVRLHCVFGRECADPRSDEEKQIVEKCIQVTEDAIVAIEKGEVPVELNLETLWKNGGFSIGS